MYSEIFCKIYNEFGWNYYPEIFAEQLLQWLDQRQLQAKNAMDLACGTGVLCKLLRHHGIAADGMDFSAGMIEIARQAAPACRFDVADMRVYRPNRQYDLVTCTGDAINHVSDLQDVGIIFENVYAYTAPGGYFVFDLLNENEIAPSDPFEMDFSQTTRVWFQITRPTSNQVQLCVRVYENGTLAVEETIRETIHDPAAVCALLRHCGFEVVQCADYLLEGCHGTTWFVIAKKAR